MTELAVYLFFSASRPDRHPASPGTFGAGLAAKEWSETERVPMSSNEEEDDRKGKSQDCTAPFGAGDSLGGKHDIILLAASVQSSLWLHP